MGDLVITGASRGIGRALTREVARRGGIDPDRLVLLARSAGRLDSLAAEIESEGTRARALPADLSVLAEARRSGERLADLLRDGATLVHNAGIWPHRRELTPDGFERAFAVNHLGPLAIQEPPLERGLVDRVLVISAGLIALGRFDPERTPTGDDFSSFRTYCTTKLCFAVAMRDVAAASPDLDVLVMHPGVVRTGIGARPGPVGWLLSLVKRAWEAPETCARRLARVLEQDRWSERGRACWMMEEERKPWPAAADDPEVRRAVSRVTAKLLEGGGGPAD